MARARQIRAGRAYVELGVEDRLTRGLRAAQRQLQDFGQQVRRIGTRLAGLGAAITAPLLAATRSFARTGDDLDKMARRTGLSVEALSELGFAAQKSGTDLNALAGAVMRMNRRLGRITAGQGQASQVAAIEALGLSLEQLERMNPEQRLLAIAEAMSRHGNTVEALSRRRGVAEALGLSADDLARMDPTQRLAAITEALTNSRDAVEALAQRGDVVELLGLSSEQLERMDPTQRLTAITEALTSSGDAAEAAGLAQRAFGTQVDAILPLLMQGADGIERLRQRARELGLTISTEAAAEAAKFTDRMTILRRVLQRAVFTIGGALAPTLGELVERFTKVAVKASAWIKANRELVVWVAKVGAIITAAGGALIGLGLAISLTGTAIGGLAAIVAGVVKGFVLLKAAIAALATPIGLVIVGVGALGAYLIHATDMGGKALAWLGERFEHLRDVAMKAFQGIGDALAAGDIALAARVLWLTLRKEWLTGTRDLRDKWTDFKHEFLRTSADAWFGSLRLLARALYHIERAWTHTRSFFARLWNDVRGDATETWNAIVFLGRRAAAHTRAAFDDSMDLDARLREIDEQFTGAQHAEQRRRRQQERENARDRDRRIAQAERDLEGTLDTLIEQHADRLSEIDKAHEKELDETAKAIKEAKREWQEAIEDARRAREAVGDPADAPDGMKSPRAFLKDFDSLIGSLRDVAERTVQVRGTFSAAAIQGLAVSTDAEQRTATATEQTARNTKRIHREMQESGPVFT